MSSPKTDGARTVTELLLSGTRPKGTAVAEPRPARSGESDWDGLRTWGRNTTDRFLPASCLDDPEAHRHARLISRFGFLGAFFGILFAAFYFLVGHLWGTVIVSVCSVGFALMPWLLRRTGSLSLAGNTLSLILTAGFTALCCVEGGMYGHAIAWLASAPLCALLLVGRRAAVGWVLVCTLCAAGVITANLLGAKLGPTYDLTWHPLITAAGYISLISFLFLLALIFELGRERAFGRMQEALKKLEASNGELARLNEEKNEFLGIAAHDLKNPLTAIIGTADLLRLHPKPELTPRLAANILSAGNRMLDLIKNLLDANAIEEGRFTSDVQRCDLRALARESVENNLAAATRKEIGLQVDDGAPAWCLADRNASLQVIDNLLSNAVKYSPSKTTVRDQWPPMGLYVATVSGAPLATIPALGSSRTRTTAPVFAMYSHPS